MSPGLRCGAGPTSRRFGSPNLRARQPCHGIHHVWCVALHLSPVRTSVPQVISPARRVGAWRLFRSRCARIGGLRRRDAEEVAQRVPVHPDVVQTGLPAVAMATGMLFNVGQ
jgi:hypothetical protein